MDNHPQRIALTDELHARPFQRMEAPGRVLLLAFKQPHRASERDIDVDRAHLVRLLDQYGVPHPDPDARQHIAVLDGFRLKWECHTEFVTYTFMESGAVDALFQGPLAERLDPAWLKAAPGQVIAAAEVELIAAPVDDPLDALTPPLLGHFDTESVAAALVLDENAVALGDFRIDQRGFTRFAIVVTGETGPRRLGRAVQRFLEIEVYRTMALLTLPMARAAGGQCSKLERQMSDLVEKVTRMGADRPSDQHLLDELTALSTEVEAMSTANAFRMDAAKAYSGIVTDRVQSLNEVSLRGRQQFGEFLTRRFEPAIRTIEATRERQAALSIRAARLAELLRTRVSVQLEEQNQQVLERMDKRADLQLRLQQTVEGLSVVAISYYALGLLSYFVGPAEQVGISKTVAMAALTLPVIAGVWYAVRRIRSRIERKGR